MLLFQSAHHSTKTVPKLSSPMEYDIFGTVRLTYMSAILYSLY